MKNYLKNLIFFLLLKKCLIDFKKPAFFEDNIEVKTSLIDLNKVKINFNQKIIRNSDLLVVAEVLVILVNSSGKISKLPNDLLIYLKNLNN